MPLTTAVNPQTNETAVLVDGAWAKADQVAVNPKDQSKAYLISGKWVTDTGTADLPQPKSGPLATAAEDVGGVMETSTNVGSGMLATPVAGLAGLAQGASNLTKEAFGGQPGMPAADRVNQVSQALTYQPSTEKGKQFAGATGNALSYLSEKPGEFMGEKSRQLAEKMGASPALQAAVGATVKTGTEVIPQALAAHGVGMGLDALKGTPEAAGGAGAGTGGAAGASAAPGAADAAGRAQAYVANLGLDWGKLSEGFKGKLTEIAGDAQALGKLNQAAVKRQGLLAQVGIDRATSGQLTRDATQRGHEISIQGTEAGKPLKALDQEQNATLLKGFDDLRKKVTAESLQTGSKAQGDLPVGRSVQDSALRAKATSSKGRVDNLFKKARKTEPDATAPADSFYGMLEQNPSIQHLGWVQDFLKKGKVTQKTVDAEGNETLTRRPLNIGELQDLRVRANAVIKSGGPDAHYAADVKQSIDKVMEENAPAAAPAWKQAIDAYRKHKQEFSDQGAVKGLVEDKPFSSDRKVAIEDTAHKTVLGRLEDLQKVKRSLLTGEDPAARAAGKTAWRDLKGWTLDYIRSSMTKGPKGEADAATGAGSVVGEGHVNWVGLKRALDNISDENLDEIFGQSVRKQLRRYQDAAEVMYTTAPERIRGSPTFEKIVKFLDRLGGATSMVGGRAITDPAAAVAKGIKNISEFGVERRDVNAAMTTPLDEQLSRTRKDVRRSQNLSTVKKYQDAAAPAAVQRPQE
jgi:hypothetical protein